MIRIYILLSLLFFLNLQVSAQLTVTGGSTIGMTPTEFVQTYLVGTGVAVSNATYNGSAEPLNSPDRIPLKARDEIGSFSNSGGAIDQLGISGGVLLSSGYVTKAVNGTNPSDDMWGNNQPAESDPDLVILAGNTIHDKSILEFDFVPQTDVITFNYVFGSIEFDGFCASINDAFGLFLSGPGIAGGFGFTNDAVNIALLPNSTSYVTIFNICEADQGNLGNGVYSWWNLKKDYFSYNRLTYVFSASYSVVCNQTYHMKFAIGDASDGVLDSGVFLEQNSFSSNNVTPNANSSNPFTGSLLVPGCSTTEIFYSILQPKTMDISIELAIDPSGTATQSDILPNPFPSHVVIPAGQLESPIITIQAIPLNLPQPDKSLVIAATVVTCGVPNTVTTTITIRYSDVISVTAPPATICSGGTASLTATVIGGQPFLPSNSYQYLWNTGAATSTISVNPGPGHHDYSVAVTDACDQTVTVTTWVDVGTTPEAAGIISGNTTLCTPANGLVYSVPPIPGADEYTWNVPPGATIVSGIGGHSRFGRIGSAGIETHHTRSRDDRQGPWIHRHTV